MRRDVKATSLIEGTPFGTVYPPRAKATLPVVDPRTAALRVLRRYVSELTFHRPGNYDKIRDVYGPPIAFHIAEDRFHIERPDNVEDVVFPSIVVEGAEEKYESIGLGTDYDESTIDKFGRGTVLQTQYEQMEMLTLEMWCTKKPERRALIAGLQVSLIPTETMYGIRFKMPDYYDQTVVFTPWSNTRTDADEVVQGRRIARMKLEMRFNVVALVNYAPFRPYVLLEVDDPSTEC